MTDATVTTHPRVSSIDSPASRLSMVPFSYQNDRS